MNICLNIMRFEKFSIIFFSIGLFSHFSHGKFDFLFLYFNQIISFKTIPHNLFFIFVRFNFVIFKHKYIVDKFSFCR